MQKLITFFLLFGALAGTSSAVVKRPTPDQEWKQLQHQLGGSIAARIAATKRLILEKLHIIKRREEMAGHDFVPLPGNVAVDPSLPEFRRRCTPETADYLKELASKTGVHLTVMSAARSIPDQQGIGGSGNLNAAPTSGPMVSAHLFGAAVDLKYLDLSMADRVKVGEKLLADKKAGRITVALEKGNQKTFHVVVFKPQDRHPAPAVPKAAPKKTKKKTSVHKKR